MYDRNQLAVREDRSPIVPYIPPRIMMPPGGPQSEGRGDGIMQIVARHPIIVLVVAALVMSLAGMYLKRATKLYTAETRIRILSSDMSRPGSADAPGGAGAAASLAQHASIMTSSVVLEQMLKKDEIRKLQLLKEVETAMGTTTPSTEPATARTAAVAAPPTTGPSTSFINDPAKRLREKQIFMLKKAITVEVGRKDDLLAVTVETPYPEESYLLANAVVDAFDEYLKKSAASVTRAQLEAKLLELDALQREALELDKDRAEFVAQHPNVVIDLRTQHLADSVRQWSAAVTTAQMRRLELERTRGPQHPDTLKAKDLEAEIQVKLEEAEQRLKDVDKDAGVLTSMIQKATRLTTQVAAVEDIINKLKLLEAQTATTLERVESAPLPDKPSSPNKVKVLGLALIVGVGLGSLMALLRDMLDQRMRSAEEVRAIMGVPILGVVPKMPNRQTAVARAMTVHLEPKSIVAEAYRTVRTAIFFAIPEGEGRTILLTSPAPGDGKTTTASNLAIAIAQTGRRALLLDADFRKPSQHKNLDVKDDIGLSSVLAGKEPLERAIQRTGVEGLDILPCGPIPTNPSEILNSQAFIHLVQRLAQKYDHILLDSPPVNNVADARILAAMSDIVILCLRSEKSTRKSAEHARDALLSVGGRILGVVVNDVSRSRAGEQYGGSYGAYGHQHAAPGEAFGDAADLSARSSSSRSMEINSR